MKKSITKKSAIATRKGTPGPATRLIVRSAIRIVFESLCGAMCVKPAQPRPLSKKRASARPDFVRTPDRCIRNSFRRDDVHLCYVGAAGEELLEILVWHQVKVLAIGEAGAL